MQSNKNTKISMHKLNALVQADWEHAAQGDKHSHGACSSDKLCWTESLHILYTVYDQPIFSQNPYLSEKWIT